MKTVRRSLAAAILGLVLAGSAGAQDAHESLGPKDSPGAKGKAPLLDLLATVKATPKAELVECIRGFTLRTPSWRRCG